MGRKDAYGFFLQPVDLAAVPGYTDVVRRPMDFGTIASKVARGKYRSLDDFAVRLLLHPSSVLYLTYWAQEELRLVTQNAKVFNPPGSIYHTEADRIEAWAAEHVAKAAPTVIEFEADWHVQVDGDDEPNDGSSVDSDEDEDARPPSERATSSAPQDDTLAALHAAALASGRRPPQRAAVKKIELERQRELEKEKEKEKHAERPIDNALDEEGHMPGYKDGVGVFPPHDDWAPVMLALKLKGKPIIQSYFEQHM
jgi:bromodomain-containing protein 7/9